MIVYKRCKHQWENKLDAATIYSCITHPSKTNGWKQQQKFCSQICNLGKVQQEQLVSVPCRVSLGGLTEGKRMHFQGDSLTYQLGVHRARGSGSSSYGHGGRLPRANISNEKLKHHLHTIIRGYRAQIQWESIWTLPFDGMRAEEFYGHFFITTRWPFRYVPPS